MGRVLNQRGQDLADEFESIHGENGCCCHMGNPPCSYCTHPGNPISLRESDEYWEEEQYWYFTFGFGHEPYNQNYYIKFYGTRNSARKKMVENFGKKWAFQYPSAEAAGVNRFHLIEVKHG